MVTIKKRAMKKWIPEGDYCHGPLTSYVKAASGMPRLIYKKACRNLVPHGIKRDVAMTNGGTAEVRVSRCRYTGITTWEDILLDDACKVCSVRRSDF